MAVTQPNLTKADIDAALAASTPAEKDEPGPLVETPKGAEELKRLMDKKPNVPINPTTGKIEPTDLDGVGRCAAWILDSGLAPECYFNAGRGASRPKAQSLALIAAAISKGRKHGLDPFEAVQAYYVVRNSLTLWGDAVKGVIRSALRKLDEGIRETVEYKGEGQTRACTVTVQHIAKPMTEAKVLETVTRTFGMKDAAAQSLLGKSGPWQHSQDRQMMIRARTYCYRDLLPELMMGIGGTAEEEIDTDASVGDDTRKGLDAKLVEANEKKPEGTK